MHDVLFNNFQDLLRVLLAGTLAYAGLVVLLRLSGKRTLSKWNAFDLVVTVAFGSTLATILLDKSVSVAEGLVALALLVSLQFVVTWLSVRLTWFQRLVKSQPSLMLRDGELLHENMRKKRVAVEEVEAAIRARGHGSVAEIAAVVLETDGTFSVIKDHSANPATSSLRSVEGWTGDSASGGQSTQQSFAARSMPPSSAKNT